MPPCDLIFISQDIKEGRDNDPCIASFSPVVCHQANYLPSEQVPHAPGEKTPHPS